MMGYLAIYVTALPLIYFDYFLALPLQPEPDALHDIESIVGFAKHEPRSLHPCKDPNDCKSPSERIFTINKNYMDYGDEKFKGILRGFDIVNKQNKLDHSRKRRNAINKNDWPKSDDGLIYIPYVLDKDDDTVEKRIGKVLREAAEEFIKNTCFRLIPRTDEEDYVEIIDYNGCWSYVGMNGGKQYMSLSDGCQMVNIILHEFMHVIGFYHEHSRRDRDRYIKINWQNIDEIHHRQFAMLDYGEVFVHGKPFDTHSIMQYGKRAGANKDNVDSMTPIQFPNATLGAEDGASFSDSDKEELNLKSLCGAKVKVFSGPYANTNNART